MHGLRLFNQQVLCDAGPASAPIRRKASKPLEVSDILLRWCWTDRQESSESGARRKFTGTKLLCVRNEPASTQQLNPSTLLQRIFGRLHGAGAQAKVVRDFKPSHVQHFRHLESPTIGMTIVCVRRRTPSAGPGTVAPGCFRQR